MSCVSALLSPVCLQQSIARLSCNLLGSMCTGRKNWLLTRLGVVMGMPNHNPSIEKAEAGRILTSLRLVWAT